LPFDWRPKRATFDSENDFKEQIKQVLTERISKLKERLEEGALEKIDVEIYKPGKMERNSRSGKLKC